MMETTATPVFDAEIVGVPVPQGSMRAFVPKGWSRAVLTSANPNLKNWRNTVSTVAAEHMQQRPAFTGPMELSVDFYLPRPKSLSKRIHNHVKKPDLDKLLRGIFDGLTHIVYVDDAQIWRVFVSKQYTQSAPCARVRVYATPEVNLLP